MSKRKKILPVVQKVRLPLYTKTKTDTNLGSIRKSLKRMLDSYAENSTEVFQEGMGAGFLGDYEEAIEHFDRVKYLVIGNNDTQQDAMFYKAIALSELGKHEDAITVYKDILEWDKKDPNTLCNIGFEYSELENFEEAIEFYDKSIGFEPKHKESWANKAEALLELERLDEALECVNKSLEIDPDYRDALENKSGILVGLENFEEAIEISKKIVELNPEDYVGWGILGMQYLLADNLEKALENLEKSQKFDLSDDIIWYNKACVLSRLDRKEESLDALVVAVSIKPENLVDLKDEKDLENIKNTERFQKLLSRSV